MAPTRTRIGRRHTISTQPIPVPDEYERTDSRALNVDEVYAQWLQNVGAGVGVAAAVALIAWGVGVDLAAQWRWPLIVGGCVFGAGQLVRAFVDEFRAERRWRKREREHYAEVLALILDIEDMEAERDSLRSRYETARAENERLENDNAALRYRNVAANPSPRHTPIQDTFSNASRADARELLKLWYATGAWPGERTMQWTRSRHTTARDLLQRAGVLQGGAPTNAAPPPQTEAWAIARLEAWLGNTASTASTTHRGLEVDNAVDAPDAAGE